MLGAGTIINPIIKIVTTVAILAAIGFFIVKPILETTEEISAGVNENISHAQQAGQAALEAGRQASDAAQLSAAKSRAHSYISSLASDWAPAARAVRECRAEATDLKEMNACATFGERLVTRVRSNRSFSLSYADSLSAQGRGAEADRVEACVKAAAFETAAMRRCRNLADELLFG